MVFIGQLVVLEMHKRQDRRIVQSSLLSKLPFYRLPFSLNRVGISLSFIFLTSLFQLPLSFARNSLVLL